MHALVFQFLLLARWGTIKIGTRTSFTLLATWLRSAKSGMRQPNKGATLWLAEASGNGTCICALSGNGQCLMLPRCLAPSRALLRQKLP